MATRYSVLVGVSRLFLRQSSVFCQHRHITTVSPSDPVLNRNEKSTSREDDPDVFGALSSRKVRHRFIKSEPIFEDRIVDKGDVEEEKYLSFQPVERKSVETCETEIEALIKERRLKDALYTLEVTMKEDKITPSRGIYSMLIGACGKAGYTKKAFSLFNQMKKRGHSPADSHYTALFNSCANSPWPQDGLLRATLLRQQLKSMNALLNKTQYHAMMKAFGRCGEINTTFEIIDEMMTNRISVTTETLNFLLQACISSKEKGFSQAIHVWRRLRDSRVTPDIHSYNLLLRATRDCGIDSSNGKATDILLLMGGSKEIPAISPPSESNLTTVTTTLAKYPNLLSEKIESSNVMALTNLELPENRLALLGGTAGFLEELRKDHNRPDIKTFTLLLETIKSDIKEEKILLDHMKRLQVTPDVDFFNLLIKKRQYRRDVSGAKDVLSLLQEYRLYPNIMTFGVLAMSCISLQDAKEFIANMDNAGFRMNIEIFGVLLKNAVFRKNCVLIMELLDHAVKINLPLDERAIQLLNKFKTETTEMMAKHDRGIKVDNVYGNGKFRNFFKNFCYQFKPRMQQLEASLDPHPWQQFRYPLSNEKSMEPSVSSTNVVKTSR